MYFVPGWLVALVTFPGVVLHEWAHKFFCERLRVPVYEVKYFQLRAPIGGYVHHDEPATFSQAFMISFGPLLVNSIVVVLLSVLAVHSTLNSALRYFLLWLAISSGMHAFPSDHDARNVVEAAKTARSKGSSYWFLTALPFVILVFVGNSLRLFWFDLVYALMLVMVAAALSGSPL